MCVVPGKYLLYLSFSSLVLLFYVVLCDKKNKMNIAEIVEVQVKDALESKAWKESKNEAGRVYFFNTTTKATSWDLRKLFTSQIMKDISERGPMYAPPSELLSEIQGLAPKVSFLEESVSKETAAAEGSKEELERRRVEWAAGSSELRAKVAGLQASLDASKIRHGKEGATRARTVALCEEEWILRNSVVLADNEKVNERIRKTEKEEQELRTAVAKASLCAEERMLAKRLNEELRGRLEALQQTSCESIEAEGLGGGKGRRECPQCHATYEWRASSHVEQTPRRGAATLPMPPVKVEPTVAECKILIAFSQQQGGQQGDVEALATELERVGDHHPGYWGGLSCRRVMKWLKAPVYPPTLRVRAEKGRHY